MGSGDVVGDVTMTLRVPRGDQQGEGAFGLFNYVLVGIGRLCAFQILNIYLDNLMFLYRSESYKNHPHARVFMYISFSMRNTDVRMPCSRICV